MHNFVKVAAKLADELRPQIIMELFGLINLTMLQMLKVIMKQQERNLGTN